MTEAQSLTAHHSPLHYHLMMSNLDVNVFSRVCVCMCIRGCVLCVCVLVCVCARMCGLVLCVCVCVCIMSLLNSLRVDWRPALRRVDDSKLLS